MSITRRNFIKSSTIAGAAIAAPAIFASNRARAAEVTLRMHQFLPPQATVPKAILYPWADRIEAASDGRIKIDRFPAMQLGGKPPELMDQVIDGVADIVWTLPGYTPGRFPQAEVMELPFTMTNAGAASRAYWEMGAESMFDTDFKAIKPLGLWVHGPGVIHSKNPIEKVADLNGVKLRAPTRLTNKLLSSLGATAVGMPVPAIPEALSKGVVEATVIPWEITAALKIAELVGNHTEFGDESLYTAAFVFAMNKDRYEALPDDLKAVIDENSGADFSELAGSTMQEADAGPRELAASRGNTIITLSPDQVAEWKAASEGVTAEWLEDMNGKGIDGAALLARSLELQAQYAGS